MEEFGNYYIERISNIGEGGFGVVEKVKLYNKSKTNYGLYARKIFNPSSLMEESLIGELKHRFKRETRYQASCFHKSIVPVSMYNLNIEHPWFVMELAECSLFDEMVNGTLSFGEKLKIVKMLLNGMLYMHETKNFLHRDIKPQNILKFKDGSYKLSDFGLVKSLTQDSLLKTQFGTIMGTTKYMAPEIADGSTEYTKRSDIFAIGVLIEELLGQDFQPISDKCTHRRPLARYGNINEIIADLNNTGGGK